MMMKTSTCFDFKTTISQGLGSGLGYRGYEEPGM